jgi:signal transduction histidine kinase
MTADNEFTLFLDGRELGRGAEWRHLFKFDLTQILTPGRHVLAVKAFNDDSAAGMLFGMEVDLADGKTIEVKSDESWRIVPDGVLRWEKMTKAGDDWPAATIVAPLGSLPWWVKPEFVCLMPSLQQIKVYFWQTGWFQITLLCVCALVILISLRLMTQLAFHQRERWLLQRERARIARDIHDDIGPRMTMLVLHGEEVQSGFPEGSERNLQLVQICEEARGLLATMDEILWAVNPRRDTLRDFAAYVCNYAQAFLEPAEIQCLFVVDQEMSLAPLNLPLRRSLLMAIKEALNNVVKHSEATEVRLEIQRLGQRLMVAVLDNGRGFETAKHKPERNGLSNMAQRVNDLGGTCLITSEPGKGCRVEFTVPLLPPRRYPWAWLRDRQQFSDQPHDLKNTRHHDSTQNHDPTKY